MKALRLLAGLLMLTACAGSTGTTSTGGMRVTPPSPDPRVGLSTGLMDAGQALWNLRLVSATPPPSDFVGVTNSDLAFSGNYVWQGNYNGVIVWDISNPAQPSLVKGFVCPASQSDVSVYRNLLFTSGEDYRARIDCGRQGVQGASSPDRHRGIRIFDISDPRNPKAITTVQTCRGSHTHSLLVDPKDRENVYVYVSGSSPVRPAAELEGCVSAPPSQDPNSALFRIEVIRVPLARPQDARIVSSPRIFADLVEAKTHGLAPEDKAAIEQARARGEYVVEFMGQTMVLPSQMSRMMLDSLVRARGGTGAPTAADSAKLRAELPAMVARMVGAQPNQSGPRPGPTQCHDITLYPEIGLAGGACEGYGMLLDISDPINPKRLSAVADTNFSYWHSATFNNDGTKVLFSDEWGGGGGPKCRATDPKEWGADAIFTIENRRDMKFQSYFKMPAPQTSQENCVAHNGSLIPIPGRDVMVQAWYQGGINVFDWTDPKNPVEIAFFDRGPSPRGGGSWSVYWYNGLLVSSEIARGLDILELTASPYISQNEIDAAKTVRMEYFNTQGQQKFVWPPSFALARAYVDQLERSGGLSSSRIGELRRGLERAEAASGGARNDALNVLAGQIDSDAGRSSDAAKVRLLSRAVRDLAGAR